MFKRNKIDLILLLLSCHFIVLMFIGLEDRISECFFLTLSPSWQVGGQITFEDCSGPQRFLFVLLLVVEESYSI